MDWNRVCRVVLCCSVLGCSGGWETTTFTDEGDLCFDQRGASVAVTVTAPGCLSSSCSRNLEGSCSATVDGMTIELTSEISWEDDESRFAQCTDDCGLPSTERDLGELPAGSYTVVHGEDEITLVVPVVEACSI